VAARSALHLETEIARSNFEELIRPLLENLEAIDRALSDAKLQPDDPDRIILVGGSTAFPCAAMVDEHLGQALWTCSPIWCVALRCPQAGVPAGGDVVPFGRCHSPLLGISAGQYPMGIMPGFFSNYTHATASGLLSRGLFHP